MSYRHILDISPRIRVGKETIGDGTVQTDCISAVACRATCEELDGDGNVIGRASIDPWVTIDLSGLTADDYVALEELTDLPQRALDQLSAWGEQQRPILQAQIEAKKDAPKETLAPWID